ncbi:acetoacetate decarboxylase family protein [Mesorhizobium sp. CAU 1741]|uniref:acetoacetate decarboxylase family protein n=1 Tax=Mesorhizobium sp. CAU 1741 TaxID=3140366 RepID=UPI00325A93F7
MNQDKRAQASTTTTARPWMGQSWPRSSTGRSSLVEPLPHHISCEALHVTFRAEPSAIANLLPPDLEPLDTGEGWVMIAEMAKVSASNPEQMWRDPSRSSYNECVLGFYCRFGDRIGRYSALVWVDRDWSLGMGAIFGWGKRLGTIDRTRHQATNPAFDEKTHTLGGTVSRYGRRVLDIAVTFEDGGDAIDALPGHAASTFLYRYIASPAPDVPDIEQLFELGFSNVSMSGIKQGAGMLSFGDAEDEDLDLLGKVEITGGYAYQRGWTTDRQARLLKDYTAG